MIRYKLVCGGGHEFDAWFASGSAYDAQAEQGEVLCPQCGSSNVAKGVMAPNISGSRSRSDDERNRYSSAELPAQIRKFREHVERTSENVGERFADEARKIHYQEVEPRGIYGSATQDDARQLREEGVSFHPLPALPEEQN